MLRPYQSAAVDAATEWMRRTIAPGVIELPTGAGKSWVAAYIAKWVYENTGKKVLCLQPSAELTEQNFSKYISTGNSAGIFSASVGRRDLRQPVIYGTPGTVKNSLHNFGSQYAMVLNDEAHGTTPTMRTIVDHIRKQNPNLRVLGMTATPYRMGTGYIYQYDDAGAWIDDAIDPYYNTLLYRVTARELIDEGYLSPPTTGSTGVAYDANGLQLNSRGQFDVHAVEQVFEGHGRLTSEIVADVVHHSYNRRGVMLFAATVQHANEIMASLPTYNSALVVATTTGRDRIIDAYKAQQIKYLVSVGVLTTGFDAPHTDVIAVLRKTESPGLFQQIAGRGSRLFEGKKDFLLLDYAGNIEFHSLQDDVFTPEIRTRKKRDGELDPIEAVCPQCSFKNSFSSRPDNNGLKHDRNGYLLDLSGHRIETEHGPMPAHLGRRCTGQIAVAGGHLVRCEYRWTSKECPECQAPNDIAARYCIDCKAEIVDPNEKLKREFVRIKEDPYAISTDEVLEWAAHPHVGGSGKPSVRCEYRTPWRRFTHWYMPEKGGEWASLCRSVFKGHVAPSVEVFFQYLNSHGEQPKTITYHRVRGTKFYRVLDHNKAADLLEGTE